MERKEENLGADESQQEETLASPGVIDKYQSAGKISNCKIDFTLSHLFIFIIILFFNNIFRF